MISFSQEIFNYNNYLTLLGKLKPIDLCRDVDFSYITCPRREYKAQSKRALAIKVFLTFIKIVIEDIVKTGSVFKFPTFKSAYLFVGDDWSDRESSKKSVNIFDLEPDKAMQICFKSKGRIYHKLCIVQKPLYKEMNVNKDRYKLDPSLSL